MSKSNIFFDKLNEMAKQSYEAAKNLKTLSLNYNDLIRIAEKNKKIKIACREKLMDIKGLLHEAFITPIEREDIYAIAQSLDDLVNSIEDVLDRMINLNIKELNNETRVIINIIALTVVESLELVKNLANIKKINNFIRHSNEIHKLDVECRAIKMKGYKKIFYSNLDAIEIIKWKEILEYIGKIMDKLVEIAKVIDGILIKGM